MSVHISHEHSRTYNRIKRFHLFFTIIIWYILKVIYPDHEMLSMKGKPVTWPLI